jgi:hypothetical protein
VDAISLRSDAAWELMWAPYDQPTYDSVLQSIRAEDIVLEIGAGDLRLARQIAHVARQVFAIEIHPEIIEQALSSFPQGLPANLSVICGDACLVPFSPNVTVAVLLMRHCTHFKLFATKLKAAGCKRLITNSRWRMGLEIVDLQAARYPFESVKMGWYACWCGATGFITGPAERFTPELDKMVVEVSACPRCMDV